ncbi:MAG: LacI family DNA-binding transcriptional regulator [Phycisphaerae bacterium]|nr:LacI family DNA-binding transcriptional regulator [Phycisphaerae bacterium]
MHYRIQPHGQANHAVRKMTVSRALDGTGAVSATTRERILAAARELAARLESYRYCGRAFCLRVTVAQTR